MLKPFALCAALAAALFGPAALAASGPPIAGSVADFSRIDPSLPAPDDGFTDASGRHLTLADFHGKFLLLNLWATWCGPCVAEMPSLDHLQVALGGSDFLVLPISVDRGGVSEVTGFYDKHRITHLGVYVDTANRLAQHMSVSGIPTSFLVGRDGRVVGALVGATDWDTPEAFALIAYYLKNGQPAPPMPTAPAPTPEVTPTSFSLPLHQSPAQRVGTGLGPL
jgi:thiol-disulfide isomerase/thioredoxin